MYCINLKLIFFLYLNRDAEKEENSEWIKNKVIPSLIKLCPSKFINYDSLETTGTIPDSLLYQYIEEISFLYL